MVLSNYKVGAGLAVSDMDRAREFYEGKLGLSVSIDSADNVQYRCAEDSVLHIYLSPEHAGKSTATLGNKDIGCGGEVRMGVYELLGGYDYRTLYCN